ncbi:MAG: TIGR02453 family protein [Sphingopyxis sp.]|nr:TIGR02453 family protein [Sphingopyxis sp.]
MSATGRVIGPDFMAFFRDLAANQNRDWFHANKARYEAAVKLPLSDMVIAVNTALAELGVPLTGDPKRSVSRINRDVRFSSDKSPYKTYAALTFTREPGEMSPGLLYVQLAPDQCFAGIGFYAVDPADLLAMRTAIAGEQERWSRLEEQLSAAGHPLADGEALKRLPRGFEAMAGTKVDNALRLKAHVTKAHFDPDNLPDDLPARIAEFALRAMPFLRFGWEALENNRGE